MLADARRQHMERRVAGIPEPPSDIIEVAIPGAIWARLPAWLRREAELVGERSRLVEGNVCFETSRGRYADWQARLEREGWR